MVGSVKVRRLEGRVKAVVIVTARLPGSYRTKSPAAMGKPLVLKGDPLATTHEMEGAAVLINV